MMLATPYIDKVAKALLEDEHCFDTIEGYKKIFDDVNRESEEMTNDR